MVGKGGKERAIAISVCGLYLGSLFSGELVFPEAHYQAQGLHKQRGSTDIMTTTVF